MRRASRPFMRAVLRLAIMTDASKPIIATTTKSSINVKPRRIIADIIYHARHTPNSRLEEAVYYSRPAQSVDAFVKSFSSATAEAAFGAAVPTCAEITCSTSE